MAVVLNQAGRAFLVEACEEIGLCPDCLHPLAGDTFSAWDKSVGPFGSEVTVHPICALRRGLSEF